MAAIRGGPVALFSLAVLALLCAWLSFAIRAVTPPNNVRKLSFKFKESVHKLADHIIRGDAKDSGLRWLEPLVDDFGSRHLGSKALDDAIDYTLNGLQADGFDKVHAESVDGLPHWVRGDDEVTMIEPRVLRLNALAIGGVRAANVTSAVVVVEDFDGLEEVNVTGRIVLFAPKWEGYSRTQRYRRAAGIAAAAGAVGLLVKSVTPFSLGTPHVGQGAADSPIPAVAITVEEAELMKRLYRRGRPLVVQMWIRSDLVGTTSSRNTVFDIRGSELPGEVILLSAHMDSWDVGQGAVDDGGGMAAVWQAMKSILDLSRQRMLSAPKRTIRGIFWTAEEQGLLGARHYYETHRNATNETFVFVSETDQGAFRPKTFNSFLTFSGDERQRQRLHEIIDLLNSYGIPLGLLYRTGGGHGDVRFWEQDGVPGAGYRSEKGVDYYFYSHHSSADYLSVFEEGDIDYTATIFAALAHVLANLDSLWE